MSRKLGAQRPDVARCNKVVHGASWAKGDVSAHGGVFIALELAEQAYRAHGLQYEPGLSKMILYDPRRFTWIYDPAGEASEASRQQDRQHCRLAALLSGEAAPQGTTTRPLPLPQGTHWKQESGELHPAMPMR